MNNQNEQCVAFHGEVAWLAGVSDSVGGKAPFKQPIIIGITGGIASGKSSIARMFSGRGIMHVDADKLVHQLMRHDRTMIEEIANAFPSAAVPLPLGEREGPAQWEGEGALALGAHSELPLTQPSPPRGEGSSINRAVLAAHISKHPEALVKLERIIHPHVRRAELAAIQTATRNRLRAVVLDVPLMYETGADELCDVVIAAHAPLHHRRRRAFARLGMTHEKFNRLIARQWPDADRNALADIVIPTTIGKAATRQRVHRLMCEWGLK
jgi:dephospho-CoA kinase